MNGLWESLRESLSFICICVLIFVLLFVIAVLAQKFVCRDMHRRRGARSVAYIGMFAAIGGVLMLFEIPLFFAPSFYQLDLSEVPVLLCSFYLGPAAGVICEFLKVVIKLLLKGTTTAFVGDFASFFVGCSFILPASIIYHYRKTKKTAVIGSVAGTVSMMIIGSAFNAIYLLPKFADMYGMPLDAIIGMGSAVNSAINSVSTLVLFAVVPFNLLKGVIVSVITFLLYKRLEKVLFRSMPAAQ